MNCNRRLTNYQPRLVACNRETAYDQAVGRHELPRKTNGGKAT